MYLLSSAELGAMASGDETRPIVAWLDRVRPGNALFASVVSFGVLSDSIEAMEPLRRQQWRLRLAQARRQFDSRMIDVDLPIIDVWATLRGLGLKRDSGSFLGADELMVVATAIERRYVLVAQPEAYLDELATSLGLTVVTPE